MKTVIAVSSLWSVLTMGEDALYATDIAANKVTRAQAIERAIQAAISLNASAEAVNASRGTVKQVGYKPNPTLSASFEDFTGTGPFTGLGRTEATITYSQKIERGRKRAARVRVARESRKIAEVQLRINRLNISREAERAYIVVLAAKAKLDVVRTQAELAKKTAQTFAERAGKGKDSALALQTSKLQQLKAEQAVVEAEQMLQLFKSDLAILWNTPNIKYTVDSQEIARLPDNVSVSTSSLHDTPDMELWALNQERASKVVKAEKANSVQDITFNVGTRYTQETGDVSAVAGFSIPLAFNNTNAGNISRARSNLRKSEYDRIAVERDLNRKLLRAQQKRSASFVQIRRIKEGLIPEAVATEKAAIERLKRGAATYLDVYSAQNLKTIFQNQLIAEYEAFHLAQTEINRLTAVYDTDASLNVLETERASEEQ